MRAAYRRKAEREYARRLFLRRVGPLVLALAFALAALPGETQAHTRYCGHGWSGITWVATPWGLVEYRDLYANGYGAGPHWHVYRTFYFTGSSYKFVHTHTRTCRGHAVR